MKKLLTWTCLIAAALASSPDLNAEVLDSSDAGFTVRHRASVDKNAQEVYSDVVDKVGSWWNAAHTFSMDSSNLSIDDRAGGCWCEKLPYGGQVRHLEVIHAAPAKMLRMSGGLGPLQGMAIVGTFTVTFAPQEDGSTQVEFVYAVGGYAPGGLKAIAGPVDGVIGEQLARLKRFAEGAD